MPRRQNFPFSLSNKSCFEDQPGLELIASAIWQMTLVSVLLRKEADKVQIQEEITVFAKDLPKNLVLQNDVSGKPFRKEGNEHSPSQPQWKQFKHSVIVFIGFGKGPAVDLEMCWAGEGWLSTQEILTLGRVCPRGLWSAVNGKLF